MNTHADEAIDFKPFFDMIIGILFILLILISAQLFFSQWKDAPSKAELEARAAEARRLALEADIERFLQELKAALTQAGFSPAIDRVSRSVSLPLDELVHSAGAARRPDADALARLGRVLQRSLDCVAAAPPVGCAVSLVRISRMDTRLSLANAGPAGTPEPSSRVLGLTLAAALFSTTPGLLLVSGSAGAPAVQTMVRVDAASPAAEQAAGRVILDFLLVGPDGKTP
ncbi:MAG: hypothetical protein IT538_11835 [Variibacter sp.]|nr:hypothetical protein [Variibacter sp.]